MMRGWHDCSSVQQNLDDLVVVSVGGEDQWGDVGSEGGRVPIHGLPTLKYFPAVNYVIIYQFETTNSFIKLRLYYP